MHAPCSASATSNPDGKCLGHRPIVKGVPLPYEYQTFAEVARRVSCVASGIRGLGLRARDKVAVLGINCPDWMIIMQVGGRGWGGMMVGGREGDPDTNER